MHIIVGNKYRIEKKLGAGSFGDIYLGVNKANNDEKVAIKLEVAKSKHEQLKHECQLYHTVNKYKDSVGIPSTQWLGTEGDYNVMIMDVLGPSLEDLFNYCDRRFSIKTVIMLADQMIRRVEYVHSKKLLHRDIKPDNFLMGVGTTKNQCLIIDFGLAKKYYLPKSNTHIPYRENKQLTGTARYASINTHLGFEQSRRDDLESLGYVFMYFVRGSLPWQGLKANSKSQKYSRITSKKILTPISELTKGYPKPFALYLHYCRSLKFQDAPDYEYLRQIFRNYFLSQGWVYDFRWDWTIKKSLPRPHGVSSDRSFSNLNSVKGNSSMVKSTSVQKSSR
eukprot:TRINITY_DN2431_c0_g1_i1.p1 TRINITY_DN2431_c0_g1~~TRINITY_DN2431_c0_g1_i1.p1  ORF type:complete len:336 (-),score=35.70 TRINITY_DN2431_c0_g1_i1:136-1143(-)